MTSSLDFESDRNRQWNLDTDFDLTTTIQFATPNRISLTHTETTFLQLFTLFFIAESNPSNSFCSLLLIHPSTHQTIHPPTRLFLSIMCDCFFYQYLHPSFSIIIYFYFCKQSLNWHLCPPVHPSIHAPSHPPTRQQS